MKTIRGRHTQNIALLLLLACVAAANAQPLTLYSPSRTLNNGLASGDSLAGPYYNSYPGVTSPDEGRFNGSDTENTPSSQQFVSATSWVFQDTTIASSSNSLHITGSLRATGSGSASMNDRGSSGLAYWELSSDVTVFFRIDQPFNYTLQGATSRTSRPELVTSDYVALGYNDGSAPAFGAYGGSSRYQYTAPSKHGTTGGTLPAGTYVFHGLAEVRGGVDPTSSPVSDDFSASFTLDVTLAPQSGVIGSLTRNGAGMFLLTWTAPAAGNYRVVSSSNLRDWTEYIPAANRPSGPNTNTVGVVPGSNQGFFRIQRLP